MPAKPVVAFEVHFIGPGITPATVPVGSLFRSLTAVQRLALGGQVTVADGSEDEEEEDSGLVRLIGVRKGSAVFRCTSPNPDLARTNLREAGIILDDPEKIGERGYILSPLRRLSETAQALACSILIRKPDSHNGKLAEISADSYKAVRDVAIVSGETSLTGNVQRVGGATAKRCSLRVAFQTNLLYCSVQSKKTVRKLGQFLYQDVVVHGTALHLKHSWKIVSFTVKDVDQPKPGSLSEAFQAIWHAGGKDWQNYDDPAGYLKESRGQ